ncbi:MAG: CDP-2,3-bis-(O-geranylgeranyl)-sn-glycerol synthase [Methanosarcinales archaeon]|nr:MAG: CDP-2,3-bis-(O-geranylgeranyl)-sn-glycerol synthase [Methanosarcinales archaeon]
MIEVILSALWLMLPAYIANPTAVVCGGGASIDFGRNFVDGRRILGDGKTYRGLVGGVICGTILGIIQMNTALAGRFGGFTLLAVFSLSFGALLGDMCKSFIKRRLGFKRGAKFMIADQLDFVIGAWILTYLLQGSWFIEHFTATTMVIILIITPVLHRITNLIGYYVKLKKEPW